METFDSKRGVYVCYVAAAAKDNKIVKKGESYIWVKVNKFAPKEYFKNKEELTKRYPNNYKVSYNQLGKLILGYKSFQGTVSEYLGKLGLEK